MKRLLPSLALCLCFLVSAAQHPVAFATKKELAEVKAALKKYPLLQKSYAQTKADVDGWLGKEVDVPFPKDPAGGYTHDRHKANYGLLFNAGLLYQLTGDVRYANLARSIFLKYAALNPTLKNHPQATSSSPGRIFWQALNDANWLVYAGMAYDLVRDALSAADRQTIENGAFKPEVDFLTGDLKNWFDLIHNHGVWACAGVGMVGIATDNKHYLDMALMGMEKSGKSGFLAQLRGLFSPDGYYTEGPYYVRYAILPFYIFANALHNAKPELNIFGYRDQILKKALDAGLQQTNTNGAFLPINDALKEKDYTANELVAAVGIAWDKYGANEGWLTVAKKQNRVLLNRGGAGIAAALAAPATVGLHYPYKSVEYTDGAAGNEGGISLLRLGEGDDLTTLVVKYASHGLSHGHYDQLGISLFNRGAEVLQDYGSVRFIGVEQKYGGRYLPENKSYAAQTVAHNTLVVDERSHFDGKEETAEKFHGEKLFSHLAGKAVRALSVRQVGAYPDVQLRRSLYLLQLPTGKRLLVDLLQAASPTVHQYDLPFQYNGQVIQTSFKFKTAPTLKPLGAKNGYQFLWKEAEAALGDTVAQFTFLNDKTFYTLSTLVTDSAQVFFTRAGASDPNFNLRREPSYIVRTRGANQTFFNTMEIHGQYDPVGEFSTNAYPAVKKMTLAQDDADYTVAQLQVGDDLLTVVQANRDFSGGKKHGLTVGGKAIQWTGPFTILYNEKPIQ